MIWDQKVIQERFFDCVSAHDMAGMEEALREGADINAEHQRRKGTALRIPIHNHDTAMLKRLLVLKAGRVKTPTRCGMCCWTQRSAWRIARSRRIPIRALIS